MYHSNFYFKVRLCVDTRERILKGTNTTQVTNAEHTYGLYITYANAKMTYDVYWTVNQILFYNIECHRWRGCY